MLRAYNPVVWLSVLAAATVSTVAPHVLAQACESARPTDPQGAAGVSYGNAEVSFFDAASGRARVHFAVSGVHAPPPASTLQAGIPDAVVVAAQAADDALDKYAELGYVAPLSDADSPCSSNGDSDAVDIYLINFSAADGQAALDHCQDGLPKHCAGFVLVENDFRKGGYRDTAEGMRTVVPHELFHLVQDAYDAEVERWWAEGSAQWAAKQVYPELLDLERFLPDYFATPWRPLNLPPNGVITNFLYATAIWPVFLGERFDADAVREVFEDFAADTANVLTATDSVLAARGSTLAAEFLQFAAYNAATGSRTPATGGYTNAANYPEVPLEPLTSATGNLVSDVGSGMGAFYYSLHADTPSELSLQADTTRMAALLLPLVDGKVQLTEAKPLPATLEGAGIVVVAGQSLSRTDAPFTLKGTTPAAPSDPKDGPAPGSSGCALVGFPGKRAGFSGAALGFVVILLGRCRARTRPRNATGAVEMRMKLVTLTVVSLLATLTGCSSEAVDAAGAAGSATGGSSSGGNDSGGKDNVDPTPSACSAALKQSLSLVDEVSTARVSIVSEGAGERTLYVDASVGGLNGQDTHPWVYVALGTGEAVAVTDLDALGSKAWDLAFKRSVVRTNSGDSGPGLGGAVRIALAWNKVTSATLGNKALPTESWFDADCMLTLDAAQNLVTTFSGWSEYDEANHVLSAADVVFITAGADGSLYKVGILDYYGTPAGAHGTVPARYLVRVAPLP